MRGLEREDQDALVEAMRKLIARWGSAPFVASPILAPDDRSFPDVYTPDLRGVRTIARRLMRYAGLGDLQVGVRGVDRASDDPLAMTTISLTDVERDRVELTVNELAHAEEVPLVLAHEIARSYHELRRAPHGDAHPYRAHPIEKEDEIDDAYEEEISLTACFLGFGVLVALGAHSYRATGEQRGNTAITRWAHRSLGALAPDDACFLLAVQATVRAIDDREMRAWTAVFPPNQAAAFRQFSSELEGRRDALIDALGLPPPSEWAPALAGDPPVLEDDGWEPEEEEEEEEPPSKRGRTVFRVHQHNGWTGVLAAVLISIVGLVIGIAMDSVIATVVIFAGPVLAIAGYFGGRSVRRADICNHCENTLAGNATECDSCGGVVRGEIRLGESFLDAEERMREVTTFGSRVEGEQADAAPRYVRRGVKCPHCGWIPDGEEHWSCESCDAEPFDVFDAHGVCPECGVTATETSCPACDHVSPHEFWSPAKPADN